jgi:hypothetical protein
LHWRLREPPLDDSAVQAAAKVVAAAGKCDPPHSDLDKWTLPHFIEVSAHLGVIKAIPQARPGWRKILEIKSIQDAQLA